MTTTHLQLSGIATARPPDRVALAWQAIVLPLLLAMAMWMVGQAPAAAQPFDFGRDRPIVIPERPILCAPPRVMRGGRCVSPDRPILCPPPRVMRGGRCEMPIRPAVCLPPRVMRGGRCVLPAPVICAPPRVMQGGRCVMPAPVLCLPPRVMRGGRCVNPPVVCAPPRVMRGGRCVMPPRPIVCRPPDVRRGDRCVRPQRPPSCRLPYIYSARARRCVLPAPIPPSVAPPAVYPPVQRSPAPQDNISWIQACLNAAGYDAGPVDGLTGRRTREAWSDFRSDSDLGEGQAPFTDPETLAKLFDACTPEEGPATQGADNKPEGGDTSSGGDTGDAERIGGDFTPAPAMCATGKLYTMLSAEQETLEPCGRSCIPAPEGMSEEDLLEQQEKQDITWCSSCVSVGTLGMVCPVPGDEGDDAQAPAANN
ncbi:peptidoglycan-binding protein [Stappia sp. MMSF_3263]|uniref:peptidoglycan-binding domain-containing protein n=1 Tax=Stappia sp. MMSF_3263 TaxID=3046693 RepID=UPI00273DD960|nr:peptidoglycan-binding domain-containing protein [Stappia sp. MMSF_3263]